MQITHKHNKWLQILAEGDFPPKLLWSENTDLKFNASNEEGDLYGSNKQRNRKNISQCISNAKAILWADWTDLDN